MCFKKCNSVKSCQNELGHWKIQIHFEIGHKKKFALDYPLSFLQNTNRERQMNDFD